MKKILSLRVAAYLFTLLVSIMVMGPQPADAQILDGGVTVPKALYRFRVPNANKGYLLTPNYQEGINLGYFPDGAVGGIVVPPAPGWTPRPGQGLVPMHRWRVRHRAGTNYYYSADIYPSITSNSENTYEGIIGYGLIPNGTFGGSTLHLWYGQNQGYWYGGTLGTTPIPIPPAGDYRYHGIAYRLPIVSPQVFCGFPSTGTCYVFDPPPPAPICDANQEQTCYSNGGTWDSDTCSCSYDVEPLPCKPGMICPELPYDRPQ